MIRDIKAGGSARLVLFIRSAYWGAVLLIAAMATTSFLLVQDRLAEHRHDDALLALIGQQKALSQRIMFLGAAAVSVPAEQKRPLIKSLGGALSQFGANYDKLLRNVAKREPRSNDAAIEPVETILYGAPHHLDYFATGLTASGLRLVAALNQELAAVPTNYTFDRKRADLDETLAVATLSGFSSLENSISATSLAQLSHLLTTHRTLFYAIIGVIVLVVMVIFKPMARVISQRTNELVVAHDSMAYVAVHDGLTGLYNRAFLREQFHHLIDTAARRNERLAVLQIDLDRFKQINDTLGHAAGDLVLASVAKRMQRVCRASDLCVRLGGDEFMIVLNAAGDMNDVQMIAKRVLANINEPVDFQGATILPGASAGIAVFPVDADNANDLVVHADLALYASKKQGGGSVSLFSDELRAELDHRKQLEHDLARAVENRDFAVYFQPQVSLPGGKITGVEALVRWHHPERGLVPPTEFIPVAESAGLMPSIGRIVIEKAIQAAAAWHQDGYEFGRLAINVSGTELREADFSDFLFRTIENAGLPVERLSLEIVESVILDDEKTGIAPKLRAIRAAGIHLELDDFGTGYASLSHVNPNEIDRLKIDRRFIRSIDLNAGNTMIVRAIIELARGLGISLIAEGAETEAELDALLAIGCDQVQGYSIAFPMPEAQARKWIGERTAPKRKATEALSA